MARLLLHVARCVRDGDTALVEATWRALAQSLLHEQAPLLECMERCTGRTLQRRKQTLPRLLRVQDLIRRQLEHRPDLRRLAASANYSPHHLLRIYRRVFGETPAEYAARLRLQRAWRLVRFTRMPVCDITEALSFESPSAFCRAFCRAFRQAFGLTATQTRLHAATDTAQPPAGEQHLPLHV